MTARGHRGRPLGLQKGDAKQREDEDCGGSPKVLPEGVPFRQAGRSVRRRVQEKPGAAGLEKIRLSIGRKYRRREGKEGRRGRAEAVPTEWKRELVIGWWKVR